uniref:C2H2-type domain-containing protein n=1 Tax=Steinernema glaseri TaxID=37863 RepID=A0A1I8ARQ9_9BILA
MEIWKCQLCKKDFKSDGKGINLLHHIGIHEDVPCPCVIEGCDWTLRRPDSMMAHLRQTHVLLSASLNSEQYYAMKEVNKQFYKKAEDFRDKYFPPEAFIGFSDHKKHDRATYLVDPKCKECGKVVNDKKSRTVHVSKHLDVSYKCVFQGCEFKTCASQMAAHFITKHSTKVGGLNEEQLFKHKQNKLDFGKIMREKFSDYFPYKSDLPEDELF